MAHKKGAGSTRNGRDSQPKRLGVKRYGGEFVLSGGIIVRQRGTKIHPGPNVRRAGDDSLYAVAHGLVRFYESRGHKMVTVDLLPDAAEATAAPAHQG